MAKHTDNIFLKGNSLEQECAQKWYDLLMTRQPVTRKMALAACCKDYPLDYFEGRSITKQHLIPQEYNILHKLEGVIVPVINAINNRVPGGVQDNGKSKGKVYQYVGAIDNPLADLRYAGPIKDIETYWQFCLDSSGFFPMSWLEHFFGRTMTLLDIREQKGSGEAFMKSSLDSNAQKGIELLPLLYEAIRDKMVIRFDYKDFEHDVCVRTIHPQFLYEYNGRWFLCGRDADHPEWEMTYIALDRIAGEIRNVPAREVPYTAAFPGFYEEHFRHLVGLTPVLIGDDGKEAVEARGKVYDVRVRAHTKYMYGVLTTKKLHPLQHTIVEWGEHADGKYGEVEIPVRLNREFFGRILQLGAALEIVGPAEVRSIMQGYVDDMYARYH